MRLTASVAMFSGNKMGTGIDTGWYENSQSVCGESTFPEFDQFAPYESKNHAQVI